MNRETIYEDDSLFIEVNYKIKINDDDENKSIPYSNGDMIFSLVVGMAFGFLICLMIFNVKGRFAPTTQEVIKETSIKVDNPLMHMVKGDMFRMCIADDPMICIVKEVGPNSLLITTTSWLYSSSMDVPFDSFNPKWFKKLGKYTR